MGNSQYQRAKDKHLDHTEENPSQNCYFCRRNGWTDEEKKEDSGRSNFMQDLIDRKINRLEELEDSFEEHTLYDGSIRQKKKEYNQILDFLETQGLDHDRNRKVIDSDEASGYQKQGHKEEMKRTRGL